MSIILVSLFFLAAWHFVYEAMLLPSYRMQLRNELFTLRDGVRSIHLERGTRQLDEDLELLHEGINYYLPRLHKITPAVILQIESAYSHNKELHAVIEERQQIINQSKDGRVQEISKKISDIISKTLIANIGGWMIYVVPVVAIIFLLSWLKRVSAELLMAPSRTVDRIMNDGLAA